jgi:hypothetical protein
MNRFINHTNDTVSFRDRDAAEKFLDTEIVTLEDYVTFVRNWKVIHADLVDAIIYFKSEKDRARDAGQYRNCDYAWQNAQKLGKTATKFYKARMENKANLHAGVYIDVEYEGIRLTA